MDFHLLFFLIFRAGKGRWGYNTGSCYGEALLSLIRSPRSLRLQADLALLVTAAVWGSAFVVQRMAAASLGVFLFNGLRFALGAALLLPLIRFRLQLQASHWPWAVLGGVLLFSAGGLQQAGLLTTTAGNAGFITGLYVVIVPILMVRLMGAKLPAAAWIAALLAAAGIFLLSTGGVMRLVIGDLYELLGAFLWALHVILVGRMARLAHPLHFSIAQYLVNAALNLIAGLIFEQDSLALLPGAAWTVIYTGVFSVGVGYTLQMLGQRHAPPSDAALILSLEAVFAALFGWLFLSENLTPPQLIGCLLILAAILLAQRQPHPAAEAGLPAAPPAERGEEHA